MTTEQLRRFLIEQVPGFQNVISLDAGVAFHYTPHANAIEETGHFRGAPINANLAGTQRQDCPPPAIDEAGVVFGYQDILKAARTARHQEIIEIHFWDALRADHPVEAEIERRYGEPVFPTILILANRIESFVRRGLAEAILRSRPQF